MSNLERIALRSMSVARPSNVAAAAPRRTGVSLHTSRVPAGRLQDEAAEHDRQGAEAARPVDEAPIRLGSTAPDGIRCLAVAASATWAVLALIAGMGVRNEMQTILGDPVVALMLVLLVTVMLTPLVCPRET